MHRNVKAAALSAAVSSVIERLESRMLLAAVGPDGWGYVADATPFESITLTPHDPTLVQQGVGGFDLGTNTFNFYGHTYTGAAQLQVNTRGILTLGTAIRNDFPNPALSRGYQRAIAPLWDSVPYGVLAKFESTAGDATPERMIIQFDSERGVRFQVILQLNTGNTPGNIIFNYEDAEFLDGRSAAVDATVGIKDAGDFSNRLLINGM